MPPSSHISPITVAMTTRTRAGCASARMPAPTKNTPTRPRIARSAAVPAASRDRLHDPDQAMHQQPEAEQRRDDLERRLRPDNDHDADDEAQDGRGEREPPGGLLGGVQGVVVRRVAGDRSAGYESGG